MTPAYKKMLRKLDDSVEMYKLHVKHYHMSPAQFRRGTSMLGLPDSFSEKYEDMYNKCRVCSTSIAPPPRTRVSDIRASNFGDVICSRKLAIASWVTLASARGGAGLSPTQWFFTWTPPPPPKLPGHFEAVSEADGYGLESCQGRPFVVFFSPVHLMSANTFRSR